MTEPHASKMDSRAPTGVFSGYARHTAIYAFGVVAARAVSFAMLPVYTRFLSPSDYGIMSLIEMTLDFIALIGGAKLSAGVFRFYQKAESQRDRELVVATSFLLVAAMYAVVGLLTFTLASPLARLIFGSPEHAILFRIAAGSVALASLPMIPTALARILDRSTFVVGLSLARVGVQLALVLLLLVAMDLGVRAVFLSTLVANACAATVAVIWLRRRLPITWSPGIARELLSFGAPLMVTKLASYLTTFSDRWFLQGASNEHVVGLYSLSYQFGFILVMVGFTPVAQGWEPRRFRAAALEDGDALVSRGFLFVNLSLISVAVAISLFVHDALRVLATPEFVPAAKIVPLILAAYVLHSWAHVLDLGILLSGRTRYITVTNFSTAGFALAGYWLLVPTFFEWGAASVTMAAFALQCMLTYFFSQRSHPINYSWAPIAVLVGWAVAVVGAVLMLPELPVAASVGARVVAYSLFLVGVWYLPVLSASDRRLALGKMRALRVSAFVRLRKS